MGASTHRWTPPRLCRSRSGFWQSLAEVQRGNRALRTERAVFDDIYRKLENELQEKKKDMANIIEQANAAREARDQAQAQMPALKQQADHEHMDFAKELKELGKLIANETKMEEFMKPKVQRVEDAQAEASREEEKQRKRALTHAWDMSQSMAIASASQEKLRSYEEAVAQIQYATRPRRARQHLDQRRGPHPLQVQHGVAGRH